MAMSTCLSALTVVLAATHASASEFLRSRGTGELENIVRESIKRTLQHELSMDADRLMEFEAELQPLYVTLPKNEHGKLESPAVRYALHRYFVHKHGWYVVGLEPLGQAWNATSPSSAVKGRIPAYIQSLFDQREGGQGIGLHELAAFAATLLEFMHNEVLSDIMDLYAAMNLPTTVPLEEQVVDRVVRGFFLQVIDRNFTVQSESDIAVMEMNMQESLPIYDDLKTWMQDIRKTTALQRTRRSMDTENQALDNVVEDIQWLNDRLFAFQDMECRNLKGGLADMEIGSTGRVLLSDFYGAGLRGDFLFVEHTELLRRTGSLDERDPDHPSVIIANFLTSKANCLSESSFHSVCCRDECQGLLAHVEKAVAAPAASPARIKELVERLPSDTVDAPRNLSATLLSRLGEIADLHNGDVPLHGRLFAQWMHHAFPLECSFPHAAGVTSPLSPDEWVALSGAQDAYAPDEERERFANMQKPASLSAGIVPEVPWMQVEELVVPHRLEHRRHNGRGMARKVVAFVVVLVLASSIAGLSGRFFAQTATKAEKQMV